MTVSKPRHSTLGLRESDIDGNHDEQDHESNPHLEPLRRAGNCKRSDVWCLVSEAMSTATMATRALAAT